MKKIIVFVLLLLLCLLPFSAYAEDSLSGTSEMIDPVEAFEPTSGLVYESYDYVISRYKVDIVVNENNSLDVTETISAFFNVETHGIIRKIPLQNTVVRQDGTSSNVRAKISNIKTFGDDAALSKEDNYQIVKLGNANRTLTGEKTYTISYTYDLGKDKGQGYDELYFNIIGDQWDTAIDNISFHITMPKSFDAAKVGFSSGSYGTVGSSDVEFSVSGNTITGEYIGYLGSYQALTIRLELPEGYFVFTLKFDALTIISIVLPIIFAICSLFLWIKFGKGDPVVETVEFYPPQGWNSAEVGFLYNTMADNKAVMSLLIYLANLGYLAIQEVQSNGLFSKKKDFLIIKLQEYAGNNSNEALFMQGLFWIKNKVLISELYDRFYTTVSAISCNMNSRKNKNHIIEPSSRKGWICGIMLFITYLLITIRPVLEYGGTSMLIVALVFPGIGFVLMFSMLFSKSSIGVKLFALVWGLGFGGVPFVVAVMPCLIVDTAYLTAYVVGIVCIAVLVYFMVHMQKRTPYGNEMLGKIGGFKRFLETAEKPRLEELVMQNPAYFYNILPYTYALGVSEKWVKQFAYIATAPPNWYYGATPFDMHTFHSSMRTAMSTASSSASSSSGGSDGGGGSSGGGSGGGGGSSW